MAAWLAVSHAAGAAAGEWCWPQLRCRAEQRQQEGLVQGRGREASICYHVQVSILGTPRIECQLPRLVRSEPQDSRAAVHHIQPEHARAEEGTQVRSTS